jgi:hypothetical protein
VKLARYQLCDSEPVGRPEARHQDFIVARSLQVGQEARGKLAQRRRCIHDALSAGNTHPYRNNRQVVGTPPPPGSGPEPAQNPLSREDNDTPDVFSECSGDGLDLHPSAVGCSKGCTSCWNNMLFARSACHAVDVANRYPIIYIVRTSACGFGCKT